MIKTGAALSNQQARLNRLRMHCTVLLEELDKISAGFLPPASYWHAREGLLKVSEGMRPISCVKDELVMLAYQLIHLHCWRQRSITSIKKSLENFSRMDVI